MGVYIEGIEMPTGNDELRLIVRSNGQVIILHKTYFDETEAIPVPPHGRLGDLDELYNHLNEWYLTHEHGFSETEKIYIRAMLSGVKDATTVIEAEEEICTKS